MKAIELTQANGTPVTLFIGDYHLVIMPKSEQTCTIRMDGFDITIKGCYTDIVKQIAALVLTKTPNTGPR
jgi:hypothetical protein